MRVLFFSALLAALAAGLGDRARAGGIVLDLPIACDMGRECYIQNYTDRRPGPEYRDFTCGRLSYDGHEGTDFRVRDLPAMRRGVPVVAAADGEVRAVRDGMDDISINEIGGEAVEGREAGNAVAVVHPDGWETQYSHLRKGSVAVRPGQRVKAGDQLGLVGMSGRAEFPHFEFSVRHRGEPVDPFVGLTDKPGCGFTVAPLWSETAAQELAYVPSGPLSAGFTSVKPDAEEARKGGHRAESLSFMTPLMIFWADVFGVQPGDRAVMTLTAPDGEILARHEKLHQRHRAQQFTYIGKKRGTAPWPEGEYTGIFTLERETGGASNASVRIERTLTIR
jgi:hypothetical protein